MAVYRTSSRYRIVNGGILADRTSVKKENYYQYISNSGDSFELIASKLLGDGKRYWEIADLNPQVVYPDVIPTGTVLRVPK